MDMTGGYAKSVREHAPQATIVIDNYHVVALASKALEEVRREHWNELRQTGQADTAKQFKADRWALLKNPDDSAERRMRRAASRGIVALEFAGSERRARALMRAWGRDGRRAARRL
jgi:transposase